MNDVKIRCLAIDDEPLALRQLATYLGKVPYFELTGSCQSAVEAAGVLEKLRADVLFVDINMPDLNGLDFVRSLQSPPMVVFTTAYMEYAIDGYKVDAVDYLLKPFGMGDVMRAADKVRRRYELMRAAEAAQSAVAPESRGADDDALFLKVDYKVVRVPVSDIVYVEGMSEYLRVHLQVPAHPVVVLYALKRMEEQLEPRGFMRVHKSYIISLRHIAEVGKRCVLLDTGKEIPVGDSYRGRLDAYLRDMVGR